MYPSGSPHAIHQALALPLAEPGMLRADIIRSVNMLAAVGVEVTAIVHLMNLCQEWLLALMGGALEAMPIVEVDPEDFNFKGNLDGES